MGHRHLFFASEISDMDRGVWNHPYHDPQPQQLANGSFMLHRDIAAVGGVNPMPYFDLPSSNLSVDVSHHMAANPGPIQYPYIHASSASGSNRMPPNYVQTGTPCYNRFANGHAGIAANPQMEYGRTPFKRKNAAVSMAIDRGNSNVHYSAGSSSNFPIPSSWQPIPHYWAWDPASIPHGHRNGNFSTTCEGSNRNVRSRQSHALNLEANRTGANNSGLAAAGGWSHAPVCLDSQLRVLPSGSGGFNHEMNQHLAGSSCADYNMEIDAGYFPNPVHNRSSSNPLPTFYGHDTFGNRATRYSAISSYQPMGFAAAMVDGSQLGMEAIPHSRHSRPLSIVGRINERNGRSRILFDRFQPFSDGDIARSSWVAEGEPLVDRLTIYGSRNFYDQHHDMRLDIDNMSYEELLALEERIGSVSTGLPENTVSACLMESVYCSSEERNCVICLEEYEHGENLGELVCGHDFHASCVKKWLTIKNVCPVCKGEVLLDDSLKEK